MFILLYFLLALCSVLSRAEYYDTFYGTPLSEQDYQQYVAAGLAGKSAFISTKVKCAVEVTNCCPTEGRRIDGTCNNLKHPTGGSSFTPWRRLLPPVYLNETEPRKAKSGKDLPLSRRVRTTLLTEGRVPSERFTHLLTNFWVFIFADLAWPQDTTNYVLIYPNCCTEKGSQQSMCAPNKIPDDDPIHRFSKYRCINMTIPVSFQNSGCPLKTATPERGNPATTAHDLSTIYGVTLSSSLEKGRLFEGGLLKYEVLNGRIWPPAMNATAAKILCMSNSADETRCNDTPDTGTNGLHGIAIISIWFWRQHNRLATELAKLNPCWDDEKLFQVARDINIALCYQIYYYELLPLVMGRENMIRDGVISADLGFRDLYNDTFYPQTSYEYGYVLRWVHLMQEGRLKMYDANGNYVKQFPIVNGTLRTGWLATDNNLDLVTQGNFRQAAGKIDYIVDPDMAEVGFGSLQDVTDILTNDNSKSRYFGFASYITYRKYCSGKTYTCFEDLADVIDNENIERLKDVYEDVEDIDLLAGIWMERPMENAEVPPTFYCLVSEQLKFNLVSDRHWYERAGRPNAFTSEQLKEIRKASISRLLCTVGDTVTQIQPNGFIRAGLGNEIGDCDKTTQNIQMSAWKDESCSNSSQ